MARVIIYRNYRFLDKDPIIDAMRTVVKSNEKLKNKTAHEITGVATATFENWFSGTTRKPQNATTCQAMGALGYVRRDTFNPDGTIAVGFVKGRNLNYQKEIEKQADWTIKHAQPKKRKRNGKKT